MPKINLQTIPSTELIAKAMSLITQIKDTEDFDFKQDITFSNQAKCKPLDILLGITSAELPKETTQDIQRQSIEALSGHFTNTQLFFTKILVNLSELSSYILIEAESNLVIQGTLHFLAAKPAALKTNHGLFAHKKVEPLSDRMLALQPFHGGKKGIPFTPEKFIETIHHDPICSMYYEDSSNKEMVINPPTLDSLDVVTARALEQLKANDTLKMNMTLVFMPEHGYEVLLTLQKHEDGTYSAIVTEMLNLERSPIKEQKAFFNHHGIQHYAHNVPPLTAIYRKEPVYSCCGILLDRIYHVVEQIENNGQHLDRDSARRTLTEIATPIELDATITRGNQAIEHAIAATAHNPGL